MASERQRPLDNVTMSGYRLASLLAQHTPTSIGAAAASALGLVFSGAMRGRRDMVERHLRRVRGPALQGAALRRAVQTAFDSYARYWVESFRLPGLSAQEVDDAFSYEGYGYLLDALALGKGAILALPHLGGWEWAGRWVADRGHPITVVVEPLHPPELFEWFADFRKSLGMTVVALGPDAGTAVLRALKGNEIVCLLCDRDLQRSGVSVSFFGEQTTLPAGPATLALRTGAPVLPTAVYFSGRRGHLGVVRPPVTVERTGKLRADVAVLTQAIAHELEALIRAAPEQWHLFQPNWPSDPGYDAT